MVKYFTILIVLLLSCLASTYAVGTYSGGDGTSGNPYQIATTADLIEISNTSADWGAYFIQTANIAFDADETQVDWDGDNILEHPGDDANGFLPIGNITTLFTGSYDGQGYEIDNLFINLPGSDGIGLFGRTDSDYEVSNLSVSNVDFTGDEFVGGIVGANDGLVFNCYSTGDIYGNENAGLIVGYNGYGTISNCNSIGAVSGANSIGGLLGGNFAGTVIFCSSSGTVTGNNNVGGLVGFNYQGPTSYSFSSCEVTGNYYTAGGLIGINYNDVSNCYAIGDVTGNDIVGGLMGSNSGTVSNCYSTGLVEGNVDVGGLLGENFYTESNCFWDTETSNQATSATGTGKLTSEMKTKSTFTDAGWDFNGIWNRNSALNNGYPYLRFSYRIYVDATRPDDVSDGTNWYKAKKTIQAALDLATSGYEIWVAKGTYKPTAESDGSTDSPLYYTFVMINEVEIYGGFAGTETAVTERTDFGEGGANETILSGDLNDDDTYSGSGVTLDLQNMTDNCYNIFVNANLNSNTILDGFTILGINVTAPYPLGTAAIYNGSAVNAKFNNIIAKYCMGGGSIFMNWWGSEVTLNNSIIKNNKLTYGAINCAISSHLTSNNVLIYGNYGYATISTSQTSNLTFNNLTVVNNVTHNRNGTIYISECTSSFNNSIIYGNSAQYYGNNLSLFNNAIVNLNNTCYSNGTRDNYIESGSTLNIDGNCISTNPKFVDAPNGDYRLMGNSPCINTGNNSYNSETYDVRGADRIQFTTIDMGAYEFFPIPIVNVSDDYNSGTIGWNTTHFNDLTSALINATSDATVNITNYSHTGDVDMTGRTFIIGADDFILHGNLTGGLIRAISTGYLVLYPVQNSSKLYPMTNGTDDLSLSVTCLNAPSNPIKVKINSGIPSISDIMTDFWDIVGDNDLNATLEFKIDKSAVTGDFGLIRFWDGTRYVPIPSDRTTIVDMETYYRITITGINQFNYED